VLETKESCGIKLEQRLENEAVETGKCQRKCSTSGNGLTRGSISLWLWHAGYVL